MLTNRFFAREAEAKKRADELVNRVARLVADTREYCAADPRRKFVDVSRSGFIVNITKPDNRSLTVEAVADGKWLVSGGRDAIDDDSLTDALMQFLDSELA
jgi:hypothetical protein